MSDWFDTVRQRSGSDDTWGGVVTMSSLFQMMTSAFHSLPPDVRARQRLETLRQTSSVQTYANAFREATNHLPNRHDADSIHLFKRGLKPHILEVVHLRHTPTSTLESTIAIALEVDSLAYLSRHQPPPSRSSALAPNRFQPIRPSPPSATPMDLGNITFDEDNEVGSDDEFSAIAELAAVAAVRALSSARKINRKTSTPSDITKIKCFNCNTYGHYASDCKEPSKRRPSGF